VTPSFRDRFPELQYLVRELTWVRNHNLKFKEGDPQEDILLFSEGALVLIALERFLRVILGAEAKDTDTLPNLLEKATSERLKLLVLPAPDRDVAIRQLKDVRNSLLHGNYEQAAAGANPSVIEYFKSSQYIAEVEALYKLTNILFAQIDPETGLRRTPA